MLINIRLTSEKTHDKQLQWLIIALDSEVSGNK